eukprot:scaffold47869_cov29-Tisochrysis_lutea.AAC.4
MAPAISNVVAGRSQRPPPGLCVKEGREKRCGDIFWWAAERTVDVEGGGADVDLARGGVALVDVGDELVELRLGVRVALPVATDDGGARHEGRGEGAEAAQRE